MIIDYNLKILQENSEFKPRKEFLNPIVNSDKKIFEITGGNGYGKTFLLNLIAYAFWSDHLEDSHILNTIKESISRYNITENYGLTYNLEFDLPNGKKLLLSKEDGRDRIVRFEGEAPLSPMTLHKKVTVLYDVPSNPSERLNAVISDLNIWNIDLLKKVRSYLDILRNEQFQFESIRDEALILKLQNEIETMAKSLAQADLLKDQKQKELLILTNIDNLNSLYNKLVGKNKIQVKLDKLKIRLSNLNRPIRVAKKDESLIRTKQSEYSAERVKFKTIILTLIKHVSGNQDLDQTIKDNITLSKSYDYIKDSDLFDILTKSDGDVNIGLKFTKQITNLVNGIRDYINKEESGREYIIHNFLTQLLGQIDELVQNHAADILMDITKKESTYIRDEIVSRLKSHEIKNYSETRSFLKNVIENLKSILAASFRIQVVIRRESSKKDIDSEGEKYYSVLGEIDELKIKKRLIEKEITALTGLIAENIGLTDHTKLSTNEGVRIQLSQLKGAIKDKKILENLRESLSFKKQDLKTFDLEYNKDLGLKSVKESRLEIELRKNPSAYTAEQQLTVNKFVTMFQWTTKNLQDFDGIISNIERGNLSRFAHEEDQNFIKIAGSIIAYSMDNKILRIDGNYINFYHYDMVNKLFYCEHDVIINKEDISTGLASANYLRQKIENVEGDFVIVLLDEIGNMDTGTLGEVIKSIKKLERDNRLVLALLTQPNADGIEIIEY
tara:strand:+ start:2151 stop:4334 length:2184 start_codon:yes stop_codon:yes gene_type:complete